MRLFRSLAAALLVALATACATPSAHAEHPHYIHALADLRAARSLLDHGDEYNVERDQFEAIRAIDAAIGEIERAAFEDGRRPWGGPPAGWPGDRRGRLFKAADLLNGVAGNLRFEEDDRVAMGWRNAAIHHVDEARELVSRAVRAKQWDREREWQEHREWNYERRN